MKKKIFYVLMIAFSISLFSSAGQKKENCIKGFCCMEAKCKPKSTDRNKGFDLSPLSFLYLGLD